MPSSAQRSTTIRRNVAASSLAVVPLLLVGAAFSLRSSPSSAPVPVPVATVSAETPDPATASLAAAAPVASPIPAVAPKAPRPTPDVLADPFATGLDIPPPRSSSGVSPRPARTTPPSGSAPAPAPEPEPEPAPAPPASPAPGAAGQVHSLLNGYRSANGLAPLSGAGDAMAKAQAHAEEMAAAGGIWHSNLASGIGSWSALAENVGVGGSAGSVHNGFVASSGHRGNMLGAFTEVGVGAAVGADGRLYVCEVFVAR